MARAKIDPVLQAVTMLEQALAAATRDHEGRWCNAVGLALAGMERALRERLQVLAEPDGLRSRVEEVAQEIMPVLDRRVNSLREHWQILLDQVCALQEQVRTIVQSLPSARVSVGDLDDLRGKGQELATAISQNKAEEIKWVQETVNTDIGAVD
jgi:uncharacterized protein YoxC